MLAVKEAGERVDYWVSVISNPARGSTTGIPRQTLELHNVCTLLDGAGRLGRGQKNQ